jgi:4-amino-4-deoxy-L-arabinose transferase-like glycosyltransferase
MATFINREKSMNHMQRLKIISLIVSITYPVTTLLLFFIPDVSRKSHIVEEVLQIEGRVPNLFTVVRPFLVFYGKLLLPLSPTITISMLSGFMYIASIILSYYITRLLYDEKTAYLFPLLWLPNAYLVLFAFAPNADVPGLFAALLVMYLIIRYIYKSGQSDYSTVYIVLLGFLSGILTFIRENVLTAILGAFFLLITKEKWRKTLLYFASALILPAIWHLYAMFVYNISYLTFVDISVNRAMQLGYHPFKIIRYFIYGVGPLPLFCLLMGLLYDRNRDRLIINHFFLIPALALALGWPAIFEPRVALIALHALIPPASYGLSVLSNTLTNHVVYGKRLGNLLLIVIYLLHIIFNTWMAYANNRQHFSPLWRFI